MPLTDAEPSTETDSGSGELALRLKAQFAASLFALAAIAAVCWYFLYETESAMRLMRGDGVFMQLMWAMMTPGDVLPYFAATAVMWIVMMVAMMIPAVIPMLIVFDKLERGDGGGVDTVLFAGGYLLAWSFFSLWATTLQWYLHSAGWLGGDVLSIRPLAAAVILVCGGLYQLSAFKQSCLEKCRSPMGFFLANWRGGRVGAIRMGLVHGLFCIGCCWMLMLIMFVGGAMSVMTMALLAVLIVFERVMPEGPWAAKIPGFGLIGWGVCLGVFAS